jgi:hypothetical protein
MSCEHKSNYEGLIFAVIMILGMLFGANLGRGGKYKVVRIGMSEAMVIDKITGEAWITKSYKDAYDKEQIHLKPINYMDQLDPHRNYEKYTPLETRNDDNLELFDRIKKNWNKPIEKKSSN